MHYSLHVEIVPGRTSGEFELRWLTVTQSGNGRDVIKRAIIDVNSIVSGRNYDILTSIIAQMLTSLHFPNSG